METTEKSLLQDLHIEGVNHINLADALETVNKSEAVMLDVREDETEKLMWFALANLNVKD